MNLRLPRHPLRRGLLLLLAVAAAIGLQAGCATLDEKQREWIFQPGTRSWGGAAAEGLQDVWIEHRPAGADTPVRLHGLWLPQPTANAPVLLYLHGARWDVRSSANRMRRMHELGFAVLGIDYRGFGQSSPLLPGEAEATEDALAAWRWLAAQHPQSPRYVFGHSLGGAIAVNLAAQVADERGLIVEGSFDTEVDGESVREMGPGDSFGEIGLLRDTERTATVTASQAGVVMVLSREDFLGAVAADPASMVVADAIINTRLGDLGRYQAFSEPSG